MKWCYNFLKREGFSIRKSIHAGQALKENTFKLFDRFIFNVIKFRKDMQIIEDLNRIGNINKTPIWFDIMTYNSTISKIGEKNV